MFSIVPFITLSLLFHVLSKSTSALPQLLLDSFGMVPSALLLFLLLALETIFLFTLPHGASTAASMRQAARAPLALPYREAADPCPSCLIRRRTISPQGRRPLLILPWPPMRRRQPRKCSRSRSKIRRSAEEPALEEETAESDTLAAHACRKGTFRCAHGRGRPPSCSPRAPSRRSSRFRKPAAGRKSIQHPVHDVLKSRGGNEYWIIDEETKRASKILTDALKEFNIDAEVTGIRKGPVITLFEVLPAQGVRVSKIANLSDNIALRLAAPSVRICRPDSRPARGGHRGAQPGALHRFVQGNDLPGRDAEVAVRNPPCARQGHPR